MKEAIVNFNNYIRSLSLTDILVFSVLIVLIILIVILINILKSIKSARKEEVMNIEVKEKKEEEITLPEVKSLEEDENENFDLSEVTAQLENAERMTIELTPYEEEQEEKAIISYDELVKAHSDLMLNYAEEQEDDGVVVKKVDMGHMTSQVESEEIENRDTTVRVISYEKEEAFLQSLKQLQQLLNS